MIIVNCIIKLVKRNKEVLMIVDDKGNVFENRRKNKEDRRKNKVGNVEGKGVERRTTDRRRPSSEEKNKEINR